MRSSTVIEHSDLGSASRARRPFRVADYMILIAALFCAAAWDRGAVLAAMRYPFSAPVSFGHFLIQSQATVVLYLPFLISGSLAQIAFRLQRPRPPWDELRQQPGTVACALATAFLTPVGLMTVWSHLFSRRPPQVAWARIADDLRPERLTIVTTLIGMAVLVAWVVLKATGQWKPEASWIDRLGRVLGVGWIVMILGGTLQLFIDLARLANAL
jgi:hypothetical protein